VSPAPGADRGVACLLLHAHMPYVEGFGTWPFGEEWLWEAIATVYLPLIDTIRGQPVTVGLTPVLCDQLELCADAGREARHGGAGDRFLAFLREVRAPVHAEDAASLERAGEARLAAELRRAARDYEDAERAFEALGGDLVGAFRSLAEDGPVELWAGPATHPVLPLLATDAGRRLQLEAGLTAHELRFGRFGGGLWLPECAYEPGLERELADFGVRAFCVDQTHRLGLGAPEQLEPVATAAGPVAVPLDWDTITLVWETRSGYPSSPYYRDHHHRTEHDLKPWSNMGAPYHPERAAALAAEHARDFVDRCLDRLDRYRAERGRPGLLCCALDAELLGHWWYEGPLWLRAVLEEGPRRGLELATLPAALERVEPVARELAASSWGRPKDLSTWDAPAVAELAFQARDAELRLVAAARDRLGARERAALARATRELLVLQASDWSFMVTRALAGAYPWQRVREHRAGLGAALAALRDFRAAVPPPELRNLAPALDLAPLLAP
jgi:1,4-alpha-glucan branching enzyme